MLGKICITENCKNEQMAGSHYCKNCYKERKRLYAKQHYVEHGKGIGICKICGHEFTKTRHDQKYCHDCYTKIQHATSSAISQNPYHRTSDHSTEHRNIARLLGCISSEKDEIVHHINLNPRDNSVSNLVVMNRSDHFKFHLLLNEDIVKNSNIDIVTRTNTILQQNNIIVKRLDKVKI